MRLHINKCELLFVGSNNGTDSGFVVPGGDACNDLGEYV